MNNVEQKLEKPFNKVKPGLFSKKPTTIAEAIAPIQSTIDNLEQVCKTRCANAEAKGKQIEKLQTEKAVDEAESSGAEKLAKRLNDLLYSDDA